MENNGECIMYTTSGRMVKEIFLRTSDLSKDMNGGRFPCKEMKIFLSRKEHKSTELDMFE